MRIDAHVMFRKPTYLPEVLWPRLDSNRFDACIAVQRQPGDEEADWLLQIAAEHTFIRGVVLCADSLPRLDELQRHSHFRGIFSTGGHSLDFYRELGRRDIPLDINTDPMTLQRVLDAVPDLRTMVPARAGLPAAYPRLHVKLAGLTGPAEQHKPLVDEIFPAFGPERILFGSNWPDCLSAGTWKQTLATFTQAIGPRTMNVRSLMLGDNAAVFYKLC